MVGLIIIVALTAILLSSLVWLWVGGIDYMAKNYPDYKGEDFLNWDKEVDDYEIGPFNTPEKKK
jgi:hypothetical protein